MISEHDYLVMPHPILTDGTLLLRAVEPKDIESIRKWRNSQVDILRQNGIISSDEQQHYFEEFVWPEMKKMKPKQILLSIYYNEVLVGYGGLVHIDWLNQRAEISFLVERKIEESPNEKCRIFSHFLDLIKKLCFLDLKLFRIWTETYANRDHHISILEANGLQLEGRLRSHVVIDGKRVDSLIHSILINEWNKKID